MRKEKKNWAKLSKKENTIQVIKFALFSASAGIIEALSFALLDFITPWGDI